MSNQIIKYMWTEEELWDGSLSIFSSPLLLVHTNLQPFLLPPSFTILCLSKLPPTSDNLDVQVR